MLLAPPVARRRDDWFKEVADTLEEVRAKVDGFRMEDLANNESFISATIQASRIAIGVHQQEKRDMLRNALLNIATGRCPNEEMQQVYLNAIESFTTAHVKVLNVLWNGNRDLHDSGQWNPLEPYRIGTYSNAIKLLHPELHDDGLLQYIMMDLKNKGFANVDKPSAPFPQPPAITNMGIEFMGFILKPKL